MSFIISQSDLPIYFVKSFEKQKILINSNLVVLSFMVCSFYFKRSLLNLRSWNRKIIQKFFSIVKQGNQKNLEIVTSTNSVLWCLVIVSNFFIFIFFRWLSLILIFDNSNCIENLTAIVYINPLTPEIFDLAFNT